MICVLLCKVIQEFIIMNIHEIIFPLDKHHYDLLLHILLVRLVLPDFIILKLGKGRIGKTIENHLQLYNFIYLFLLLFKLEFFIELLYLIDGLLFFILYFYIMVTFTSSNTISLPLLYVVFKVPLLLQILLSFLFEFHIHKKFLGFGRF